MRQRPTYARVDQEFLPVTSKPFDLASRLPTPAPAICGSILRCASRPPSAPRSRSVAIGWQIYDITRDPVALGYVGLASSCRWFCLCCRPETSRPDDRRFMLIASYAVQSCFSNAFSPHPERSQAMWAYIVSSPLLGIALVYRNPDATFLPFLVPLPKTAQPSPEASAYRQRSSRTSVGGFIYRVSGV